MIPEHPTPAQAEALDNLFHNCDLIGRTPLPCEITWTLQQIDGCGDG